MTQGTDDRDRLDLSILGISTFGRPHVVRIARNRSSRGAAD
jgi:hypothetical protein